MSIETLQKKHTGLLDSKGEKIFEYDILLWKDDPSSNQLICLWREDLKRYGFWDVNGNDMWCESKDLTLVNLKWACLTLLEGLGGWGG